MASKPPRGSTWMQDNLYWLREYLVRDVLTIPGSHDAGMDRFLGSTAYATEPQVVTQIESIYGQLQYGIRWFDIRPMSWGSDFYCGHFTSAGPLGSQGAYGEKLDDVIDDVNKFTKEHKELVVLRITHLTRGEDGKELSSDQHVKVLNMLYDRLVFVRKAEKEEHVLDFTLDKYVGTNQCVVVATRAGDGEGNLISDKAYELTGCLRGVQTSTFAQCFAQIGGDIFGNLGVLKGTTRMQDVLFPTIPQALVEGCGGPNLARAGYVFNTDYIRDDAPMTMCLAASRALYETKKLEPATGRVVVAYGGQLFTDVSVVVPIYQMITNHQKFKIQNSLFGGVDPWVGSRKSCCIFYSEMRSKNEGDGFFWKGRFAREGETIDFATDIRSIWWHNHYLSDQKFRQAYTVLITALMGGRYFRITINDKDHSDKTMEFLQPDPAVGTVKRIVMRYQSVGCLVLKDRNIYEHSTYDLFRDIDWIRYENWVVDEPQWYAQFFDRVDRRSTARITVKNEVFGGRDPAKGKRKTCTMSLRSGPGGDRERSAMEFEDWDVASIL